MSHVELFFIDTSPFVEDYQTAVWSVNEGRLHDCLEQRLLGLHLLLELSRPAHNAQATDPKGLGPWSLTRHSGALQQLRKRLLRAGGISAAVVGERT